MIEERERTYQTSDQIAVERAYIAAKAAMEGLRVSANKKPEEPASEGLYRLGLHVAIALRSDGVPMVLPADEIPPLGFERHPHVGIVLWQGPCPLQPGVPYTMALITHPCLLALVNWRQARLPIFEDGYMGDDDMASPPGREHRMILAGLLRLFGPLVEELERGGDWNWPDPDECEDGEGPDEAWHPEQMLESVREMLRLAERTMTAAEVMET